MSGTPYIQQSSRMALSSNVTQGMSKMPSLNVAHCKHVHICSVHLVPSIELDLGKATSVTLSLGRDTCRLE